jgi:hypothetical protein
MPTPELHSTEAAAPEAPASPAILPPLVAGLTVGPPVIGRIAMGFVVQTRNGFEPVKADHFTLTALEQGPDHSWVQHPLQRKIMPAGVEKLMSIPVRVAYNDLGLNIQNRYCAFSEEGRVLCAGDGKSARRVTTSGIEEISSCPGGEQCEFGRQNRCMFMSRIHLKIEGQDDFLGNFALRTTSLNTTKEIAARLAALAGMTNGQIVGIPLQLRIVRRASMTSNFEPFYCAYLTERDNQSMFDAIKAGRTFQKELAEAGLDQNGLEKALLAGLANGALADVLEDPTEWLPDNVFTEIASSFLTASGAGRGLAGLDAAMARLDTQVTMVTGDGANQEVPTFAVGDGTGQIRLPSPALESA